MQCLLENSNENLIIEPKESPSIQETKIKTLVPDEVPLLNVTESDDECVICYQTLYRPARTECGHSACENCLLHWALMAMQVDTDNQQLAANLTVYGIKFKCPTCRTYAEAKFDVEEHKRLQKRYPDEYATRAVDLEGSISHGGGDDATTTTMVVMFGNSHRKVPPSISPYSGKTRTHEWTFFVQVSEQDLVEQVSVVLHPTFREDRMVRLTQAPFSTTHLGWGYFTVFAGIQLKQGFEWVDEARAVDSDTANGHVRDILPLEWLLDFQGNGSQRNRMVKFRKTLDRASGQPEEEEAELDLGPLVELMSKAEIAEYRQMKKLRDVANRKQRDPLNGQKQSISQ